MPYSDDAERIVLRQYMRGLRTAELAKKLSLELIQQTLDGAMQYTERIEAGMERYVGLNHEEHKEEPMEVGNINTGAKENDSELVATLAKIQKGQKKLSARLSRMESKMPVETHYPKDHHGPRNMRPAQGGQGQFSNSNPIVCFTCGGNHYRVGCPQRPPRLRAERVQPSAGTPPEN